MITALIVCSNQETLLKQHLSSYEHCMNRINGDIIIVDDGSTDCSKDYIQTHFPHIRYMRTPYEEGYCVAFNKALNHVQTPYILCVDPSISISHLDFPLLLKEAQANHRFILALPVFSNSTPCTFHRFNFKKACFYDEASKPASPSCEISELMLLDTKRIQLYNGLPTVYYNPAFSWVDLIQQAQLQGQSIATYETGTATKNTLHDSLFSHIFSPDTHFKDQFLFQWRHHHSFLQRLVCYYNILLICLTFKPKQLISLIHAGIHYLFHTQNRPKPNWTI